MIIKYFAFLDFSNYMKVLLQLVGKAVHGSCFVSELPHLVVLAHKPPSFLLWMPLSWKLI